MPWQGGHKAYDRLEGIGCLHHGGKAHESGHGEVHISAGLNAVIEHTDRVAVAEVLLLSADNTEEKKRQHDSAHHADDQFQLKQGVGDKDEQQGDERKNKVLFWLA